jgi:hypothetical protein
MKFGTTVKNPSMPPWQVGSPSGINGVPSTGGSVTAMSAVAEQEVPSRTVAVYNPAVNPVAVVTVCPLDQLKLKGPPLTLEALDTTVWPSEYPTQLVWNIERPTMTGSGFSIVVLIVAKQEFMSVTVAV